MTILNREAVFQKQAQEILLITKLVNKIPVPVEEIVSKLGIKLSKEFDITRLKYSGVIRHKDGQTTIWVNSLDSFLRQRFTIAHEIGHYILHFPFDLVDQEIEDTPRTLLKSPIKIETEANNFAGELLMPKKNIIAKGKSIQSEFPSLSVDKLIEKLAKDFSVSVSAMTVRLKSLKILN